MFSRGRRRIYSIRGNIYGYCIHYSGYFILRLLFGVIAGGRTTAIRWRFRSRTLVISVNVSKQKTPRRRGGAWDYRGKLYSGHNQRIELFKKKLKAF